MHNVYSECKTPRSDSEVLNNIRASLFEGLPKSRRRGLMPHGLRVGCCLCQSLPMEQFGAEGHSPLCGIFATKNVVLFSAWFCDAKHAKRARVQPTPPATRQGQKRKPMLHQNPTHGCEVLPDVHVSGPFRTASLSFSTLIDRGKRSLWPCSPGQKFREQVFQWLT